MTNFSDSISHNSTLGRFKNRALTGQKFWLYYSFLILAFLFTTAVSRTAYAATGDTPPNFILLIADDLGWHDVGYHGSEIRTPNLDRMVRDGLELDAFYSFSVCSSTRAGVETGVNPARFGVRTLEHHFDGNKVIPKSVPTIAERLKGAGYVSHMIGKWHLSTTFQGGPLDRGYEGAFGFLYGQIDHFTHEDLNNRPALFRDDKPVTAEGHMTDLITKEAARVISRAKKPFFLNIRYSAPHYPLQAPESYIAQYKTIANEHRRIYAAMVSHMDASIGEIIAAVRAAGKLENTIFVFFSDNGAEYAWSPKNITKFYNGRFGPYSAMGSNWPLKGEKTGAHEGGIRVPAVVYGPGLVKPGKTEAFTSVLDLVPTIVSLAGGAADPIFEGKNLSPLFQGGDLERNVEFYWFTASDKIPFGGGKQDAIRLGNWKYIESQQRFRWLPYRFEWPWKKAELYDLSTDPNEANNLIEREPEIAETLRQKLHDYAENHYAEHQ